ncbi:MAG: dienelactone hydrolase family protein [Acidimicrobiales bacterium]
MFVGPVGGQPGPGILVLHSWWGLNNWVRDFCRRLADEGYTVLAPDLLGGETPATATEGEAVLATVEPNNLSGLVLASTGVLQRCRRRPAHRRRRFLDGCVDGVLAGGAAPDVVKTVVTFYGAQSIDFDQADATFQGHFADDDHLVSEEDRVTTEAFIRLGDNDTDFHLYPDTQHWFFESATPSIPLRPSWPGIG